MSYFTLAVTSSSTTPPSRGAGMARLARGCASLMLFLFSAGSLLALGGDALARPLPVTARDILAQVELASGLGPRCGDDCQRPPGLAGAGRR